MNLAEWKLLSRNEQDVLVQKYGITRRGDNVVEEVELEKVPVLKVEKVVIEEKLGKISEVKKKKGRKKK